MPDADGEQRNAMVQMGDAYSFIHRAGDIALARRLEVFHAGVFKDREKATECAMI